MHAWRLDSGEGSKRRFQETCRHAGIRLLVVFIDYNPIPSSTGWPGSACWALLCAICRSSRWAGSLRHHMEAASACSMSLGQLGTRLIAAARQPVRPLLPPALGWLPLRSGAACLLQGSRSVHVTAVAASGGEGWQPAAAAAEQHRTASHPPPAPPPSKQLPHLRQLSEEQLLAVTAPLGTVRVVAGPGSGKVRGDWRPLQTQLGTTRDPVVAISTAKPTSHRTSPCNEHTRGRVFTACLQTRVLTSRIAHLIQAHGAQPYQILAITFTNKVGQGPRAKGPVQSAAAWCSAPPLEPTSDCRAWRCTSSSASARCGQLVGACDRASRSEFCVGRPPTR